jgi:HK97 family phage major capsid protein
MPNATIPAHLTTWARGLNDADLAREREIVLAALDQPDADEDETHRADALATEIERRQAANTRRAELLRRMEAGDYASYEGRGQAARQPRERSSAANGPGDLLLATDGWRAFVQNDARGRFSAEIETRALLTTGDAQTVDRTPYPQGGVTLSSLLLDVVPVQLTQASLVEWIGETAASSAAPGAGATPVAEGTPKPGATIALEPLEAKVETIATWVDLTRQLYDDNQGLNGWLNARLTSAVRYVLDQQAVDGDGTSPNLRGLLNTPGIQTLTTTAGDSLLVAARKAITLIQMRGQAATHIVANPLDAEDAALATNQQGDLLDVSALQLPPVITDPNMPAGTFVVGSFGADNIALRVRQQTRILLSDSHVDNFKKNILVILAETRAALAVWNPASFVKGTLT